MVQISVALCLTYTTHLFFLIVSMHLHWLDACSSTDSIDEQFLLDWWFKLCCPKGELHSTDYLCERGKERKSFYQVLCCLEIKT